MSSESDPKQLPKESDDLPHGASSANNGGAGADGNSPGLAASVDPSLYFRHTGRGQGQVFGGAEDTAGVEPLKRLVQWDFDEAEKSED